MDRVMESRDQSPNFLPPLKRLRSDLNLTLAPSTPPPPSPSPTAVPDQQNRSGTGLPDFQSLKPEERGVRLVQLLLACAAHTAASNVTRADACLRIISALSSPTGDSMQRLAARLASSLSARLLRRRWPGILSVLHHRSSSASSPLRDPAAHLAFARALPYLPFAHAVAGRALLRALAQERVVHLVDLGATHASLSLWAPVLRALSRMPRGLKLTCLSSDKGVLDSLGTALAKEAESLDVPFQFNPVKSSLRDLDTGALRVRPGEALAVVSVLSLHELLAESCEEEDKEEENGVVSTKRGGERMDAFLAALRAMTPKVVVAVEQESDHNAVRMVDRFKEVLHYYSAVFDSVESAAAAGTMAAEERAGVEEMLGREMENVVACEGEERVERHERTERWAERMAAAGWTMEKVWNDGGDEGRRVVEGWPGKGRYGMAIYGGCPTICWHNRPLYSVSAWQCT